MNYKTSYETLQITGLLLQAFSFTYFAQNVPESRTQAAQLDSFRQLLSSQPHFFLILGFVFLFASYLLLNKVIEK